MERDEPPYEPADDPRVQQLMKVLQNPMPDVYGNKSVFVDDRGRPLRTPYYVTQLQVVFDYWYPWIVYNALKILAEAGFLDSFPISSRTQERIVFFHNAELASEQEKDLLRTHAASIAAVIDEHSDPQVAEALGKHLEGLVRYELRVQGFEIVGANAREYGSRAWTETGHDLDFIAEHRSGRLKVGVEVKNTLQVVPQDELEVKIRMCEFFGLRPLFATRWNKPYLERVDEVGGFNWMFRDQFFPPGMEPLANKLRTRLELPAIVSTEIPPHRVPRFAKWVAKLTADQP